MKTTYTLGSSSSQILAPATRINQIVDASPTLAAASLRSRGLPAPARRSCSTTRASSPGASSSCPIAMPIWARCSSGTCCGTNMSARATAPQRPRSCSSPCSTRDCTISHPTATRWSCAATSRKVSRSSWTSWRARPCRWKARRRVRASRPRCAATRRCGCWAKSSTSSANTPHRIRTGRAALSVNTSKASTGRAARCRT